MSFHNAGPQKRSNNTLFGSTGASASDPFFSDVTFLMPTKQLNVTEDVSSFAQVFNSSTGIVPATANAGSFSGFGAGIFNSPTSNAVRVGVINTDVQFTDFTLECRVCQVAAFATNASIGGFGINGVLNHVDLNIWIDGDLGLDINLDVSGLLSLRANLNTPYGTWTSVCVERFGNLFTLYSDGVIVGTITNSNPLANAQPNAFGFGCNSNSGNGQGSLLLNEMRLTRNVARYKGLPYTPATGPFPIS